MTEISATEQPWNSATTLYIARKLQKLAQGRSEPLRVLDMGCGDGGLIRYMHRYGHELYGYDDNERVLRANLGPIFGDQFDERIHIMKDTRHIPFEDNMFDVIYSNQVWEHVQFLDRMVEECARVLKPGGMVVTLFPFATYPLEGHSKVPFVHWLPPGKLRRRYLWLFFWLRLRPRSEGKNAVQMAEYWDHYLSAYTYYRMMNEVVSLAEYYFEGWETDTGDYIRAKLDLMESQTHPIKRFIRDTGRRLQGKTLDYLVTHYWGAVFCMMNPKKPQP